MEDTKLTIVTCRKHLGDAVHDEMITSITRTIQIDDYIVPGGCQYCTDDSEYLIHWARRS